MHYNITQVTQQNQANDRFEGTYIRIYAHIYVYIYIYIYTYICAFKSVIGLILLSYLSHFSLNWSNRLMNQSKWFISEMVWIKILFENAYSVLAYDWCGNPEVCVFNRNVLSHLCNLIVGCSDYQLVAGIQDLCHSTWQRSWAINTCCFGEWNTVVSNDKQKQSGHFHCVLMQEVFLHTEAAMARSQSGCGGRISVFSE